MVDELPPNMERLMAQHPALAEAFKALTAHVRRGSTLSEGHRILIAMRVAVLRDAPYEWAHLVVEASATPPEMIVAIAAGATAPGWSDPERALLRAVDELILGARIEPETKEVLVAHLTDEQMVDLVTTVGTYNLAAMATRTFGVSPEDLDDGR